MVIDSLRYWVEAAHVDGFRFDLATTLARGPGGFDHDAAFFAAIRQDPVLAPVKLIAEPWDLGPDGYRVGAFPPDWSEWNDQFRRTLRGYWAGAGSQIADLADRMTGSGNVFNRAGRSPRASVNFVTVHDGFTLADLVSYERKHNEANGEDNRDGTDDNQSTNCGVEGPTDDLHIVELRRQMRRNFIACLMLAQGVPLLLAGDEVGNSQGGNNNAYCQDNPTGWVDWSALGSEGDDMTALVAQLTALRRRFPQLRPHTFAMDRRTDGACQAVWLTPQARAMTEQDWLFRDAHFLSYVLAAPDGARRRSPSCSTPHRRRSISSSRRCRATRVGRCSCIPRRWRRKGSATPPAQPHRRPPGPFWYFPARHECRCPLCRPAECRSDDAVWVALTHNSAYFLRANSPTLSLRSSNWTWRSAAAMLARERQGDLRIAPKE